MRTTPHPQRRLVSLADAADILGVDPRTVRRYIARGKLPAFRVGPRLLKIDAVAVEALLKPVGGKL